MSNSSRPRFALFVLAVILVIVSVIFFVGMNTRQQRAGSPGGMDGCLSTSSGAPVMATVWVDDVSRDTYEDGCFFFAALTPGKHQFFVQTDDGKTIHEQSVVISSGQAIGLGTIQIGN